MLTRTLFTIAFALALCSLLFTENAYAAEQQAEERPPSMFKVGDEWLALPEVFSVLDFAADSTPASDEDIPGQLRLRSTRFWGRLYLDGWPQTVQYFRAHFGVEPPRGRKRFVFAEPRDACTELSNADILTEEHVLLVHRGSCTFGTKAKNAEKTKASAIIIINNEPGIDHLPGPDAHDINFSVSSITQQEGQLLEAVYDEEPNEGDGFGRRIEGYMVPINCERTGAKCMPATVEERNAIKNLVEGGIVQIERETPEATARETEKEKIEYLLAHFGTKVTPSNVSLPLTLAKPVDACLPLENDVRGKAVLVRRGGCNFHKKAEEVQAAGGKLLVIGNSFPYLVRMGVEPRWKGLNTVLPIVMVSKRAYSILVAETYANGKISLIEDEGELQADGSRIKTINSATWEPLEKLHKGEGWPRSEAFVQKRFDELKESFKQWPDRTSALTEAFHLRMKNDFTKGGKTAPATVNTGVKSDL